MSIPCIDASIVSYHSTRLDGLICQSSRVLGSGICFGGYFSLSEYESVALVKCLRIYDPVETSGLNGVV